MTGWHLRRAAAAARDGGLIAYPTEAVWGLGCDPADDAALLRLIRLKQRSPAQGLILVAADWPQLRPWLAVDTPPEAARGHWPGPFTYVLPAAAKVSPFLRGAHSSLAVRISAHPVVRALCGAFGGALVSTSANRHGRAPARSLQQARRAFGDAVDYYLPGALGDSAQPSRIIDGATGAVLRP